MYLLLLTKEKYIVHTIIDRAESCKNKALEALYTTPPFPYKSSL